MPRSAVSILQLILVEDSRGVKQDRVHNTSLQAGVCNLRASVCAHEAGAVKSVSDSSLFEN